MSLLDNARKRLRSVLEEISRIAEFEFPYKGSENALRKIEQLFTARLNAIDLLTPSSNAGVVRQACSLALREVVDYLPLLGFIVRSTNVRNAFEVFSPLLRMASDVLAPHVPKDQRLTQLVVSSEWMYSPFIFRDVPGLPDFVLIGLPSPESSNPLLIPLAGHELGHSVWVVGALGVQTVIEPLIVRQVLAVIRNRWPEYTTVFPGIGITQAQLSTNVNAIQTWAEAVTWAVNQAEETFCDFIGLRLFGTSYLEAFAYLLAPAIPGERALTYPNTLDRVDALLTAAAAYSVTVPPNYRDQFDDNAVPALNQQEEFRLSVADQAVRNIVPDVVRQADRIVVGSGLPSATPDQIDRIYARYKLVVPAEKCPGLPDILNAAWKAYRDQSLWQDNPQIAAKKDEVLKELVLKNIELFEIEQILR